MPGKTLAVNYEYEDGRWQYAMVVQKARSQLYEVNATTGRVTDIERTSAAEEAKEAAADRKAAGKARK